MLRRCLAAFLLLAAPGFALADTLAAIEARGSIRLGVRADAIPFSFKDTLGEPAGYSVQLCRAVAVGIKDRLGLAELKVEYVEVTAEDRLPAVVEGRIDLLCEATTVTLGRRAVVDFSSPTFITGMGVLYRADGPSSFAGLQGKRIGARLHTTTEATLRRELERSGFTAEIVGIEAHQDGLAALAAAEIDAYFADRAILLFLQRTGEAGQGLVVSDLLLTHEPYALALKRGDTDFRLAVDTALSHIFRSEAIDRIYAASFGAIEPGEVLRSVFLLSAIPD